MADEEGPWTPWSGRGPRTLQEFEDFYDALDQTSYGRRLADAERRTYESAERDFGESGRRFNATHSLASQTAAASRAYQQGQLANERKRIELEAQKIEIERGKAAADEFRMKAELGLGLLDREVELKSTPDNYWKLQDFNAGLPGRAFVPEVLSAALAGGGVRSWGAPGGVPTPQGFNTVIPQMTGGQPLPAATMPSPFLNQPTTFEGGSPAAVAQMTPEQVQAYQMASATPYATPSPGTRAYNDGGQTLPDPVYVAQPQNPNAPQMPSFGPDPGYDDRSGMPGFGPDVPLGRGGQWVNTGSPRTTPAGMQFTQNMVTLPNGQTVNQQQAYEMGWDFQSQPTQRKPPPVRATPQPGVEYSNHQLLNAAPTPQGAASGTPTPPAGGSGSGTQQKDYRTAAIQAILKTMPPSGTEGWANTDQNALKAIAQLYALGGHKLKGGVLESWDPTTVSLVRAGGKRLGYEGSELFNAWAKSRPVMGSALEAA